MNDRKSKPGTQTGQVPAVRGPRRAAAAGRQALVTRGGLARALGVSVRTVDRMVASGEIVPFRMRGWSVRFHLPDVLECLRDGKRKWGRKANAECGERSWLRENPAGSESQKVSKVTKGGFAGLRGFNHQLTATR